MLEIRKLRKTFDGVVAVNNVSLRLQPGTVTALIGPNGAGKTTLFNVITGHLKADSGQVVFKGEDITNLAPHEICRRGIARSFQIVNVFPRLSVSENVLAATLFHKKIGNPFTRNYGSETGYVTEVLETVGLFSQADLAAAKLSYGDRKVLDIAIALACGPELLLLDEPTAGLGPEESRRIIELIRNLQKKQRLTLFLVEHDMDVVFALSERIIVMHEGMVIAYGRPEEVRKNERVRQVYLGEEG
ncbi:MAG: ABC transporter ATP-binding protein [Deltaproteobacteria bacterium]|nr:ABC transporter ATP-binding protein [Deltaproteobacteria bacterium]